MPPVDPIKTLNEAVALLRVAHSYVSDQEDYDAIFDFLKQFNTPVSSVMFTIAQPATRIPAIVLTRLPDVTDG